MASYGLTIESGVTITSGITLPSLESDDYFEYTTLLLPGNGTNTAQNNTFLDGSTNNFTITRNGNTTQGTFSPFSQTGWGNYFSGSNYISYASSVDFSPGAGSFTVEFWCYPLNTSAGSRGVVSNGYGTNTWHVSQQGANLVFYIGTTGLVATSILTENTWQHIACVRNGSTNAVTIYKNGTAFVSGTNATNSSTTNSVTIGTSVHVTTEYFVGYISNARMVKGVEVYTGNFTPPASPLASTQSAGTNISAITGTQTSFLTCQSNRFIDNSVTPKTITATGSPTVVAFSPFNPTASWSAATYGGSGYFDGSGDYLSLSTPVVAATGDFTIEGWFYLTTTIGTRRQIIYQNSPTDGAGEGRLAVSITDTGYLSTFVGGTNAPGAIFSSQVIQPNTWYHFAYTRNSNTFTQYLNGVSQATPLSGTASINQNPLLIGYNPVQAVYWFGYLANIRIVNGTAVYTSNFTPPTAPLTAITNTSLLLNFTNAGIYDATSKNDLETVGNAQISTTQSKFGGSSMSFDGTGDYLVGPSNNLVNFGTGAFTIEGWVYALATPSDAGFFTNGGAATGSLGFYFLTGYLRFDIYNGGGFAATTLLPLNQWVHIACVRSGNTVTLYQNGTSVGSSTITDNNTSSLCYVGTKGWDLPKVFNGYMQDVRITKGYARYTANFTPPTAAFSTF